MKMNKPRKLISAIFSLMMALMLALSVCACSFAEGDTVTLAEMKAQAPERLQMTVTTDAGETITVDAPVILPDADALPVLLCCCQRFEMAKANAAFYPNKQSRESTTYKQFASSDVTDEHPFLTIAKESAKYLLRGKTDTTERYALPMGETPPENDFTLERAIELILHYNAEFGGNPDVDLRLNQAAAMSGLCKMTSQKVTDASTGVSFGMIAADPSQPVKGKEKGLWNISLAQYLHGVRVIDDTNSRYYSNDYWPSSTTWNESLVMDEDNFRVLLSYLQEERTLTDDSPLASWDTVENTIRTLIMQDKLKSVYQVELVYLVKPLRADNETFLQGELTQDNPYNWSYALVPVWEIKGWNLYDTNAKYFASGTSPDRETILMNGFGERYKPEDYVMRLNADTAAPFEFEDKVYDGEVTAQ